MGSNLTNHPLLRNWLDLLVFEMTCIIYFYFIYIVPLNKFFFKLINLQPSLRGITYIGFYEIYAGLKSTSLNLYHYKWSYLLLSTITKRNITIVLIWRLHFYPTKSRIYELPGASPINPRKNKRILIYFSKEEAFDGITVGPKSPNL